VPSRHVPRLAILASVVAAARASFAAGPPDPVPAEDRVADSEDGVDASGAPGPDASVVVAAIPATFVEIAGAMRASLPSSGEARTTWRYGRARGLPVDETGHRIRVSGVGRTLGGLRVGFSVAMLTPALRAGTYDSGNVVGTAVAWARQDRSTAAPDLEWDSSAGDAGDSSFAVTVTSIRESAHSSDRRGSVTIDVTDFVIHGSIDATLPCARSVASMRQSCRAETIHGSF
jgi:hypothetical protein